MKHHIVIGGGLIGLLTAYYLTKSGEKVSIIEKGEFGRESSWAGGGILSPLYPWRYSAAVNDLAHWSQVHYPQLVADLKAVTNIDPEYHVCGMLTLDSADIEDAMQWANRYAAQIDLVDKSKVTNAHANLNADCIPNKSIWLPGIAQVRNPRLVKALLSWLQQHGVALYNQSEVDGFIIDNDTVYAVTAGALELRAERFIIAGGAWSNDLLAKLNTSVSVEPVRGQMIMIRAQQALLSSIILKQDHYLIPRMDGRVLIGSTLEHVGFNKQTTQSAYQQLLEFAFEICPTLANFTIEAHWAGLRPGSFNSVPKICKLPMYANLYLNTGHFRNGVVTAPASAHLLRDLILDKDSALDASPYTF